MVVLSRNRDGVLVLHQGVLIQPRCTPLCHFADLLRRLIENVLNLFYRFLLFKMCFPKSLQNTTFIPLKSFCFTVFFANFDDFLLDSLIFLLSDLGPSFGRKFLASLPNSVISFFDDVALFLELLKCSFFFLSLCLCQFEARFFYSFCLLLSQITQVIVPTFQGHSCIV